MRKRVMVIKDPNVAKLFADEIRRHILSLLRHQELSTTDLAKALAKNHSSIIHHLQLLVDAGLVRETRQEKVRNMVQSYYEATAHRFIISYSLTEALSAEDEGFGTWRDDMVQGVVDNLSTFGFKFDIENREKISKLVGICMDRENRIIEELVEKQIDHKLERPIGRALTHLIKDIKLSQDDLHKKAIKELIQLLGVEEA